MQHNKVLIFGTFDRPHLGHVWTIEQSLRFGSVTVVVGRDTTVASVKHRTPVNTEKARLSMMRSLFPECKFVLGDAHDRMAMVRKLNPDVICLGYDQTVFVDILSKYIRVNKLKIKVVRLKPFQENTHKSSLLPKGVRLVRGVVMKGLQQGRTIGYPTANIKMPRSQGAVVEGCKGVYVGQALLDGKSYQAGTVIGMRMQHGMPLVEAHLIGFKGDCYGKTLSLLITKKIRNLKQTRDPEVLKKWIEQDMITITQS